MTTAAELFHLISRGNQLETQTTIDIYPNFFLKQLLQEAPGKRIS